MTRTPRWLCALVVLAVAFTGPVGALAPSPAAAQSSSVVFMGDRPPEDTEPTEGRPDRRRLHERRLRARQGDHLHRRDGGDEIGLLLITFGTAVRAARSVWLEGCFRGLDRPARAPER